MKAQFISCITLTMLILASPLLAATPHDGAYYFDALKTSMLEVLAEHQPLFNKTAHDEVKSPDLVPEEIYKYSYNKFKRIIGHDFQLQSLTNETDPAKIAPVLSTLLQAGRITIARSQKAINTEQDGSVKLKKFIPAVFGRLSGERFEQKTGVVLKQTTLGKNGFAERNSYNKPLDWEKADLHKFKEQSWPVNKGIGQTEGKEFHYIKPIYIKKACLGCHGVPIGDKGPYGHAKEGYEVGDIRGGISVTMPLQ